MGSVWAGVWRDATQRSCMRVAEKIPERDGAHDDDGDLMLFRR